MKSKIISLLKDEKYTKHNELVRALIMVNPDNSYMLKAIKGRSDFETLMLDKDFRYYYRAAKKSMKNQKEQP